jgi:5-methylcytosine-specific restriction endonuclease McrA
MQRIINIPFLFWNIQIGFKFAIFSKDKRKAYNEYIKSKDWAKNTVFLIKRSNNQCEICGSQNNLQRHHISYKNFGYEKPEDLLFVCEKCHNELHLSKRKFRKEQIMANFEKILQKLGLKA